MQPNYSERWLVYFRQKMVRLYVPFLFWTGLYLVLRLAKHRFSGGGSAIDLSPAIFLNGSAEHLWFLPFALLLALLCYPVGIVLRRVHFPGRILISCVAIVFAILISVTPCPVEMRPIENPVSYFLGLSWDALPAGLLAIPATLALAHISRTIRWVALGVWVAASIANLLFGVHPLVCAVAGTALLWALGGDATGLVPKPLLALASFSFAIYLIHVAFVEAFQVGLQHFGIGVSFQRDILVASATLIASVITGISFRRVRLLRGMVT
jgi:surface polysaccharide O-acyltransferase-like enzyme